MAATTAKQPQTLQRTTKTPIGGKKPVKPIPQTTTTTAGPKKPVPAPIKAQRTAASTVRKPITTIAKPPAAAKPLPTTSKPSQPRLPTVSTANVKSAPKPPATTTAAPAAETTGNWINRTVQNKISGVGNYAGGLVNSVGDGVNKFGEGIANSITNTTRGWGQGVAGYGNDIKDQVGVGGKRVATAGNPLGLAGKGASQGNPAQKAVREKGKGSASNPLGI